MLLQMTQNKNMTVYVQALQNSYRMTKIKKYTESNKYDNTVGVHKQFTKVKQNQLWFQFSTVDYRNPKLILKHGVTGFHWFCYGMLQQL